MRDRADRRVSGQLEEQPTPWPARILGKELVMNRDKRRWLIGLAAGLLLAMVSGANAYVPCGGAELNGDGFVGVEDLMVVINNWDGPHCSHESGHEGDCNEDGRVDVEDLIEVILHWGETCPR
jgi:hypothetical protein